MTPSIRLFFIGFIFLILSACGGGSTESSNTRASSIVALGDSIGAGFCGTVPWGIQLGQALGVPVVNDSAASRTTAIGLSRVDGLLATHRPSHLVILLGTNDARQNMVNQAVANMSAIVQKARAVGVVPVVGTVIPNFRNASANALAEQISNAYRGIPGAVVADVRSAFNNNSALLCDGLHANAAGQTVITASFRSTF